MLETQDSGVDLLASLLKGSGEDAMDTLIRELHEDDDDDAA